MKERPILFSSPMVRAILDDTKTQTRRVMKLQPDSPPTLFVGQAAKLRAGESFKGGVLAVWGGESEFDYCDCHCPYGAPGDRLWVKETFIDTGCGSHHEGGKETKYNFYVTYVADGEKRNIPTEKAAWDDRLNKAITRQHKYCPKEPTNDTAPDYLEKYEAHHDWLTNEFRRHRPSIFMPRWASRITLEIVSVRVERLNEISYDDALAEGIGRVGPNSYTDGTTLWISPQRAYEALWESINGNGSWALNPWVWVIEFRRITA